MYSVVVMGPVSMLLKYVVCYLNVMLHFFLYYKDIPQFYGTWR